VALAERVRRSARLWVCDRRASDRRGVGFLGRPALIPAPEWSLEELRKGIAEAAEIAIIAIENGERPPIFLLKCGAARSNFLIAERHAPTKSLADRLI